MMQVCDAAKTAFLSSNFKYGPEVMTPPFPLRFDTDHRTAAYHAQSPILPLKMMATTHRSISRLHCREPPPSTGPPPLSAEIRNQNPNASNVVALLRLYGNWVGRRNAENRDRNQPQNPRSRSRSVIMPK